MNGRTIARILLAVVLIGGAISIGVTSYNAGVTAGLVQSGQVVAVVPGGGQVVAVVPGGPYYVGYGYGWDGGHGFGFFGFLGGLVFLLLMIGLLRAAFGGHRRGWGSGGRGGSGGPRGWGGDWRRDAWEGRVRETHDALHRDAAAGSDTPPAT